MSVAVGSAAGWAPRLHERGAVMSSMQLFPPGAHAPSFPSRPDSSRPDFWTTARRAPRRSRMRALGTPLFFVTITSAIAGAGVAALHYGDPDRWDPPAHASQPATLPAALDADAGAAPAMPEVLASDLPPACTATADAGTASQPTKKKAVTRARRSAKPQPPAPAEPTATE